MCNHKRGYTWNIYNGRRFTKSALRILSLSTFRVSSINYCLVCSLPIHTRSSANAKGPRTHCQLKSCKTLHKCSTDCILKGLQPVNDLKCHSRSLPLLPFWYVIRDFLLVFHCKHVSVLHRYRDINTYLPKIRRNVTLTTPTWGIVCRHKTNTFWANPCTKFDDSIFSHSREI